MRQLPTTLGSWVLAFEPWSLVFVFMVVLVIGSLYWSIGSVFGPYFLLLLYRIGSQSFVSVFSHRAILFFSFIFALLFLLFSKSYPHLLLLTESLTFELLTFRLFSWSISLSLFKHGLLLISLVASRQGYKTPSASSVVLIFPRRFHNLLKLCPCLFLFVCHV